MATRKTSSATKKTAGSRLRSTSTAQTAEYTHQTAKSLIRPEVGVQPRFKKRKPPAKYQYDASLAPELQWDGQNPARERGEHLIAEIEAASKALAQADDNSRSALLARIEAATRELKALSKPFLNWAGKAERLSFDVPTLPLFIHERLRDAPPPRFHRRRGLHNAQRADAGNQEPSELRRRGFQMGANRSQYARRA